jgi:hypothetical protein
MLAASYVPLAIHELTTDFADVQAALAYLRGGGEPPSLGPLARFLFIEARVVSWPLVGLIVDGVTAAMLALVGVFAIVVWRSRTAQGDERTVVRWLGIGLVWTALALTFASPSLATVVRGLPNDHYHAFADPMVFVLVGLGAAALWRGASARVGTSGTAGTNPATSVAVGRVLAIGGVLAIVAWAATHQPPATHPDGGFPAAAGRRLDRRCRRTRPDPAARDPDFKSVESYATRWCGSHPGARRGDQRGNPGAAGFGRRGAPEPRRDLRFALRAGHRGGVWRSGRDGDRIRGAR